MNNLIHLSANNQPLTTSLVLAEGAGIQHKNALELIKAHVAEIEEFGPIAFETRKGSALPQGGFAKSTTVAILNERQATLVLTFFKNTEVVRKFKVALVKAFYEMSEELKKRQAAQPAFSIPQTYPEALRLAADLADKNAALIAQAKEDAPKVAFAEDVTAQGAEMTITAAAKTLGISPRKLFDWMRAKKLIYAQSTQAMQSAITRGWLVVRFADITHSDGGKEKKSRAHVTGKGLFYLYERLREEGLIDRNPNLELAA